MAKRPVPQASSQMSEGVPAGSSNPKRDMGTGDGKGLPVFEKLDVSKMENPVVDAVGLTWGETSKGIVIEHN